MNIGWMEILIILLVFIVLFGAAKLPELARSMGRSMRIFKSEMKEMKNENGNDKSDKGSHKSKKDDQIQADTIVQTDAIIVESDSTKAADTTDKPAADPTPKSK